MWIVVALIWIALVAGIFWVYGRRRRRAVSERTKELSALIAEAKMAAALRPAGTPLPGATAVAEPVAATIAETFARKARLLGKADAWLYLLFRAGLPDHEIFANVALAEVIEPAADLRGYEREQRLRKLAQTFVNVVICNKQLEIIAVALYPPADAQGADAQRYAEYCVNSAGIRIVRIDPTALPRHHQVRSLVYGDSAQTPA